MTVKELFEQIYEADFSDVLGREVLRWVIDECDYDILEIKLK